MRYTDLRTAEADKADVWCEDDEILQCYGCQGCGRDGWASVREKVATMIVCGECGARRVVNDRACAPFVLRDRVS